jgi:YYY domain-containing protein
MFLDWLMREGWLLPTWWLLVTLAGAAAFPFCLRFLGGLPDKGYTFARVLGMLLVALLYWLLASYGFVKNGTGGMIFAWLLVLCLGLLAYFRLGERVNWRAYWAENKRLIFAAELLFLVLMMSWFVYRAYQNDTYFTEKPMEMNFISGIMRSETFPPNDPWMAGYSISYYHFGYIMAAMLTMLSGVNSGYGFSMTIVLLFSLTGLSIFGVGYNLARSRAFEWGGALRPDAPSHRPAIVTGLLATFLVVLGGNFQLPLIQIPYNAQSMPVEYFEFWDVQDFTDVAADGYVQTNPFFMLSSPFTNPATWNWNDDGWFGWHSSRILVDYNIDGSLAGVQPIDETPIFSFLLMDVHPHVLALPFVSLALGLALNIVLTARKPKNGEILLYGLAIGGLIFLNTWDAPIYLVILSGAEALRRLMENRGRLHFGDWLGLAAFAGKLVLIAVLAYLPFLIGFRSQASGLIPNLITPSYLTHYFIMFGPMLLLSGAFLGREVWIGRNRLNWGMGFAVAGWIFGILLALLLLFMLIGWLFPETRNMVGDFVARNGGWQTVIPVMLERRLWSISLPILLLLGIAMIVARLFPSLYGKTDDDDESINYSPATGIALLLLAAALVVTLIPEFVYLRDNFGVRINTIFKFYYQAWIFFGIASAYGVYAILLEPVDNPSVIGRTIFGAILTFVVICGLAYPIFGVYTRGVLELGRHFTPEEQQRPLSLDGRANNLDPDYFAAVQCLGNSVQGDDMVVAEASDRTYNSPYGRLGAFYGFPTVINWENHEGQWRGASYGEIAGTRRPDIDTLYTSLYWDMAVPIIERYSIDYIMFGPTEREQYGSAGEEKFLNNLSVICESGDARIYVVGEDLATGRE